MRRPYKRRVGRIGQFLVFFAMFLGILGAAHYYVWARLIRGPAWPEPWFSVTSGALVVLFVSLPLTMLLSRQARPPWGKLLTLPSYVWLGTLFLLFVCVLGTDAARALNATLGWLHADAALEPTSQQSLNRSLGLLAATLGLGGSGWALVQGRGLRVKEVEVPLSRLPQGLDGLSIVQLSDVHVGPSLGSAFVRRVVQKVNQLDPDLVVITGDLVDGPVQTLGDAVAELRGLRSRHGTFFVTGNHEYYSGAPAWCHYLQSLGIRVLRNERVSISHGADSFDLAGIDDYHAHQFGNGHGADLPKALAGRDATQELVLLAHQPRAVEDAAKHGVGLQLSGHTHGGQLWPFSWLVKLQQPIVSGLHRVAGTWIYVSNGTGYWGPPMRLGAPAEVTRVVLRSEAAGRELSPAALPRTG